MNNNKVIIPASDMYGEGLFKFTLNGCTYRDIKVDIGENVHLALAPLGKYLRIKGYSKMKKVEAIAAIQNIIQFEIQ